MRLFEPNPMYEAAEKEFYLRLVPQQRQVLYYHKGDQEPCAAFPSIERAQGFVKTYCKQATLTHLCGDDDQISGFYYYKDIPSENTSTQPH